jgi:ABC-2 type transport system ATP-binding protein
VREVRGSTLAAVLTAENLTKRFGTREAVSDLTLHVAAGRAFGLLGPNGAGKTTTVRMLTGLLAPDGGSVTLFGETLTRANADALRARIGVQTDTNLYETLSVRENLRAWGELYGLPASTVTRRTAEVLEVLDLSDRIDSLVGELSKGMRQKLSVGRAVLHEPELLFLDEPTAGLDPEAAVDLIDYLKQMIRALHTTVIICTHQLHGLESLCDDVGILKNGRLAVAGDVQQLLRQRWPRHEHEITFDGDPRLAGQTVASTLGTPFGPEDAPDDGRLSLALDDADAIASVVAALVRAGIRIRAVVPKQPTLHDLYFAAIEDRDPS